MKKHFYILAIILFSLISFQSTASHLVGSDISYECTSSPGIFKVTMKIYRDCAGIPLCPGCTNNIPTGTVSGCTTSSSGWSTQILGATTGCTGVNYGAFTLNAVANISGFDIIQTCTSVYTICTNCNTRTAGTFSPGIEVFTYEGNVDLSGIPTSCCRILLGANTCCRNGALTTIVPGSFQTVCEVNRCQLPCNSAPIFTNDAAVLICGNSDFVYNLGAMDPDGDSLSYAFGQSLQGIGSPVSYVPPYSATYPFPYFGAPNPNATYPAGLRIDPITGDVMFRPIGVFVSNLVIEVTQWKLISGVRVNVGMTRRDVQFQTMLCTSNLVPLIKTYRNGILQTNNNYSVYPGIPLCLDIVAEDQSALTATPPIYADTTDLRWNNPGSYSPALTNATFTRNYILSARGINGPKADSFKFCWTPSLNAVNSEPYLFTVTGKDRFCPIKAFAIRGITIKVNPPKIAIDTTTKKTYCNNRINTTNLYYRTSNIAMNSNNVFTVTLSDSSGSFTNATTIGTKTSTDTVGFISITIPSGLLINKNYRMMVYCTSDVSPSASYAISFVAGFSSPIITNNRDSFCKGLVATFKVTPNTAGLTFKWLKNNAIMTNETKDSLMVDSAFTYKAIVSNTGCTDTSNAKYLTVYPKPVAGFNTNNISQCVKGNNFTFTDTSRIASGSTSRLWTLNSTDTSTSIIANKSFINAGTYTVKLLAISNRNCKDSITKSVIVNPSPNLGFTINNAAQCLNGNSFRFADTSNILSGTINYRLWNFGTGVNDVSTTVNPTKVYTLANTFTIKLVIGSNGGCNDSITKTVTVYPKPSVNFTINNASQCLKNNGFAFTDSTFISSGTFTRKWNFGGGINDTATTANPAKAYTIANTFPIKLIATSNNNCKDSITKNVMVNNDATANFAISNAAQCLSGNSFTFVNISANSTSQTWSFGDGSNTTVLIPTKEYNAPGIYNVKLLAKNTDNCNDSITRTVTVFAQPTIGTITGNAAPTSITAPFAYSVLSQANSTYSWSATNGTIQSGQGTNAVNIIWPSKGAGNLMAKITNNNSCSDSTNLLVNITSVGVNNINANPFSQINFKPNPFTNELEISFTSKTKELTKLVIIDAVGKEVFVKNIPSNIGNNTFIMDEMAHLKSGVYFAHLANNNGMSQSIKLVKE